MGLLAPKMEPEWSNKPGPASTRYLNVLLLGEPKAGKSCCAVGTAPGPVFVINSDQKGALEPVKDVYPGQVFAQSPLADSRSKMEDAIVLARSLVKEGKVKTIVWDTISTFWHELEIECAAQTMNDKMEPDGRRYWPVYTKYLLNSIGRLAKIDAHLIVCSHFIEIGESDEMSGGVAKTGPGIAPLLGRAARKLVPAKFQDVVFLDKTRGVTGMEDGTRALFTSLEGIHSPVECRSLAGKKNRKVMAADFGEFMRLAGFKGAGAPIKSVGGIKR